jgi:seryl-tRNA synthetase
MAEKGAGAGKPAPKAAGSEAKAGNEVKDMRNRRLYLAGRIASLKSELAALQKERTEIDDKLKKKPEIAEEKKLRQRRVYVAIRPKELRTELGAAGAELKDILGKIKKAA